MTTASLPFSPAADRNKQPILQVLEGVFAVDARVLELASGSGQHAEYFAAAHPLWRWQPSEAEPGFLGAIAQRCADLSNVLAPRLHDLLAPGRPEASDRYDAVYCANLLHISPWGTCAALMQHAAAVLDGDGVLAVYGPFEIEAQEMAESNRAFDADLRARNPQWGIRRLGEVQREAQAAGLKFERQEVMPANNLLLIWRRAA